MFELRTGSRLHFGLMELAQNQPLRYGGLGLMLREPQLIIRIRDQADQPLDARLSTHSMNPEVQRRVQLTLARVLNLLHSHLSADNISADDAAGDKTPRRHDAPDRRPLDREALDIEVVEQPPLHCGLGCGTQLAAAVAAAVTLRARSFSSGQPHRATHTHVARPNRYVSEAISATELALLSGRGKRSGIGLHGFLHGGLVQDLGQSPEASEPPNYIPAAATFAHDRGVLTTTRSLATRSQAFPTAWRIVLMTSRVTGDMHGSQEDHLMERAGQHPNPQRDEMLSLSHAVMAAAAEMRFDAFAGALERYMELASRLFASVQAGRYRDQHVSERVLKAQQAGLKAVGQSSWGPTVFGFAQSHEAACHMVERLSDFASSHELDVIVTEAADRGATWQTLRNGVQHAS